MVFQINLESGVAPKDSVSEEELHISNKSYRTAEKPIKNSGNRIAYGCDELRRLKSVLLHTPGEEFSLINESNFRYWLFD
ncbi:MAG: hypothetical protein PHU28_08100, partial [Methanosarcinaceae archaeon]|nr:hypothetical protein [Methanosarcinaceae archaeon]